MVRLGGEFVCQYPVSAVGEECDTMRLGRGDVGRHIGG